MRRGQLTREQAAELFLRLAYSHYLVPHRDPEALLASIRAFAAGCHHVRSRPAEPNHQGRGLAVDLGLKGSAAVVTGGSKGMGRAIAEAFADDGAKVAVLARGTDAIDETLDELRRRGCPDALGISVDLTEPESIEDAFATSATGGAR